MVKRTIGHLIGSLAFLVGVILAVIVGVLAEYGQANLTDPAMAITLACIGLIVGLFNVTHDETNSFLISGIVLIIASGYGMGILNQIPTASQILSALLFIFVPSTIIVAIKNVFTLARD